MSIDEEDFEFFNISTDRLDKEWVRQPRLYFDYARKLAEARRDFEQAKSELDLVKSEIDRDIRSDCTAFGLEKITDKAVEATIPLQPEYKRALKNLGKARHTVDVYQAAVTGLDHRKKALEKLVDLNGQNYFASPRASKDSRDTMEAVERGATSRSRRASS